jgi:serine/threonine protein kinase
MGTVYKVLDMEIKEKIALKVLNPEISSDLITIERFRNELKTARKISHQNVCRMYDLMREGRTYYITMEYVSGEDLKSTLIRVGQLSIGKTLHIARQICLGLAEAHRLGVIHRDLKPHNIMIDRQGDVRIMDFGIARILKAAGLTESGVLIGTPEYMSPEQAMGEEIDQRSDIYSLGIILYELVTGSVPFKGDTAVSVALKHKTDTPQNPKNLNTHLPDELNALILKCLEKEKKERFPNVQAIVSEIDRIEKSRPTTAKVLPQKKTSKAISKKRVSKLVMPGIPLLAVMLIIAGILYFRPWQAKNLVEESIPKVAPSEQPPVEESSEIHQNGFLEIDSTPRDAQIYINDELKGVTPYRGEFLPGPYTLRIEHLNHQKQREEVRITADKTFSKTYVLEPLYYLEITTRPSGADIKIDGVPKGSSPVKLQWESRTCRLSVEKSGFSVLNETLTLKPGNNQIRRTLQRKRVKFVVKTDPPGARVYLESEELGASPVEKNILPGSYEIRLEKEGFETRTETVSLEFDSEKEYSLVKLAPVRIRIIVSPWADVYLDGKLIGQIPPVKLLSVDVGRHTIEFRRMDQSITKELVIKAKINKELYMNMVTEEYKEKELDAVE